MHQWHTLRVPDEGQGAVPEVRDVGVPNRGSGVQSIGENARKSASRKKNGQQEILWGRQAGKGEGREWKQYEIKKCPESDDVIRTNLKHIGQTKTAEEGVCMDIEREQPLDFLLDAVGVIHPRQVLVRDVAVGETQDWWSRSF